MEVNVVEEEGWGDQEGGWIMCVPVRKGFD